VAEELDAETLAFAHQMFDLARSGDVAAMSDYLNNGLPPNLTNDKGDSLLILAAYHGHLDAVKVLLDKGADTARVNDRGQTALAAAVFRSATPIVDALMVAGADPHMGGPSAVEVAKFFDLREMSARLQP